MLKRALGSLRQLEITTAVACTGVGAALVYCAIVRDPYVVLLIAPFFALGCARAKHPMVLIALSVVPAAAVVLVSTMKFALVGVPLAAYDHYFLRKNVFMLAYNDWRVATGLVVLTAAAFLYLRTLLSGRGAFSSFERIALTVLVVACAGAIVSLSRWDKHIEIWQPWGNTPTIETLVKSSQIPRAKLRLIAHAGETTAPDPLRPRSLAPPPGPLPDVFLVLQESTFPPAMLRPGYEPRTLFGASAFQRGPLHVHTYGGGTWRTEFAVAVQMLPQEFGADGLYVFHQLEGRIKRSIFTELKALGYRTMVIYPVPGSFINASAFYHSIGVDEFHDPVTLGISTGWDWHLPDATLYGAALALIKESTAPVAVLIVTISQHGPHDARDPMDDYVRRFESSDREYAAFLQALATRGKRAGVVAFGDHQPDFTHERFADDRDRYLTAYDLRCVNFACAGAAAEPGTLALDAAMLAPTALERFGFSLDGLSLLQRRIFATCADDLERCDESARQEFNGAFSTYFE